MSFYLFSETIDFSVFTIVIMGLMYNYIDKTEFFFTIQKDD